MKERKWYQWLLPGLFFAVTVFVFAPLELYMINADELWFDLSAVLPTLLLAGAASALLSALLLVLLPPKVSRVLEVMIYLLTLLLYVQGNYLTINYGALDGSQIEWSAYRVRYIADAAFWVAVIIAGLLMLKHFRQRLTAVLRVVALIVLTTQVITLGFVGLTERSGSAEEGEEAYLSREGEFTVSSGRNTIVLLLDCFDAQLMMNMYEQAPAEIESIFQNFTFYRDTVGGATRTKYAIPYIFTGRTNTEEISYKEYLRKGYEASPFFRELHSGDYDARIYGEKVFFSAEQSDVIGNFRSGQGGVLSKLGLTGDFMRLTAFRYVPNALERFFWMYSDDLGKWKLVDETGEYGEDDVLFFRELSEQGLSISTDKSCFRFYHLNGAHAPYTMSENCESIPHREGSEQAQAWGCFKIIDAYIAQLKRLGVYEESTIIVMADHGYREYSVVEQNPLFMLKLPGQSADFSVSDMPFSYASMSEFLVSCINGNVDAFENYAADGQRLFYMETEDGSQINIVEYAVNGLAYDNENTVKTGVVFHGDTLNLNREYTLGQEIFFSFEKGDTARRFIVSGFSQNEPTHTWTDGHEAVLSFDFPDYDGSDLWVEMNLAGVFHWTQEVYAFANDHLVADTTVQIGEYVKGFGIPAEYIADGHLYLRLMLPDAASPFELGESETDRRVLALDFLSMDIRASEMTINVADQLQHAYTPGTTLSFTEDDTARPYIMHGFGGNEGAFTWTDGNEAEMVFALTGQPQNLQLTMEYSTFGGEQRVVVSVNGQMQEEYIAEGEEVKQIEIPAEIIDDGAICLTLTLPDAHSPQSVGQGQDTRLLALAFKTLVLEAEQDDSNS